MMKHVRPWAPLFLLLVAVTACARPAGDSPAEPLDLAQSREQKQQLQCESGKEYWQSQASPKRGGVLLTQGTSRSSPNLDLTLPGRSPSSLAQVYQRLFSPRACFYEDTAVEPDLARSWQVSSDGRTWTFKLRDDARWHNKPPVNGRAFTSADVGWTIEMQKQGGQVRSYWEAVAHDEPDAYTVVMRLREPDADFLGKLAERGNLMFPREVKEQFKDFKSVAIGTGPFMLKEFKPGQLISLEPNPNWKELGADGKPLPYLEEVRHIMFDDYLAQVAAVRAGTVHTSSEKGFDKPEADALSQAMPALVRYDDVAGNIWGLSFNLGRAPYTDVRLRRALSLAINREDVVHGGVQGGALYTGYLPVGIKDFAWPSEVARERLKFDPNEARRLLQEMGYGPGQLALTIEFGRDYTQEAEIIGRQLEAVGVKVTLAPSTVGTAALQSADSFELVYGATTGSSYLVDRWFGPSTLQTGGSLNYYRLSDPQIDQLSAAQGRELDPARRKVALDRMQERLHEIAAFAPIMSRLYYHFISCRVKDVRPQHWAGNSEGLARVWLETTPC